MRGRVREQDGTRRHAPADRTVTRPPGGTAEERRQVDGGEDGRVRDAGGRQQDADNELDGGDGGGGAGGDARRRGRRRRRER